MTNNVEQFERLYRRYFQRTVGFIMSFGVSKEDARDLAQETFVRVYLSMDKYRREAEWAYIQTIARRLTLNKFRDDAARKRDASLTVSADDELANVPDKTPSPEDLAVAHESLAQAHTGVQELPKTKQDCVLLALGGHSYAEIAAILGISVGMVKSRLHEARQDLKLKRIELPP
jgi:RNA polymerase sigma-70 factor (ECF subfamily)